jgi:beta-galactosidase
LATKTAVAQRPLSFEELNQGYGFVLYARVIDVALCDPATLSVPVIHDRGYVLINGALVGVLDRSNDVHSLPVTNLGGQNATLSILVENQGRVGVGPGTLDSKGILSEVTLSCGPETKIKLANWNHFSLPMNNTFIMNYKARTESKRVVPAFFRGKLVINQTQAPADTFLKLTGFTKGVVFANDVNVGRYWPSQGPQVTLFVPGVFLTDEKPNDLLILELEQAPMSCMVIHAEEEDLCSVEFVASHEINGLTPFGPVTSSFELSDL